MCKRGGRQRASATLARAGITLSVLMVIATAALAPVPAVAVEVPPAGNVFAIQTNGANGAVTLGDWYTSNAVGAGAGYHYIKFWVPCGWPSGTPIFVDLFSPEMNRVSGALAQSEEPNVAYDSTQFELYGPGAIVGPGFASPAPGTGIAGTRTTYQPGGVGVPEAWVRYATIGAPVACGSYVLRSQVLTVDPLNPAGTGNDQNGWRLRLGRDNDANANNAPPANYDNFDGIVGTNDEIVVGIAQASFQQSSGAVACQTFYEYVNPGAASVTFNNFDMDGNTRLRYYAPGDPSYDPNANAGGTAGTLSGNGVWNGGTLATRVGNTIAAPTSGWWRIVNCLSNGNQLIQEGQTGVPSYYSQPPTPNLTVSKSDGVPDISPGQTVTYTINVNNTAAGATAGAANNVVVQDTLPSQFSYVGCAIPTPAQGTWTCSQAAGVVTFTQTGWINAGASAALTVTATLNQGASGSKVNSATVNYQDALANPFPAVTATDTDTVTARADLAITKTDSTDPVTPGQAFTYTLTATNNGPANATGITVSDTVPAQFTVTGVSSGAGVCGNVGNVVTCTRPTFNNGATWIITVSATAGLASPPGTYANTATISGAESDLVPANNSGPQNTTITASADLSITKTDGVASITAGTSTTYSITVTNNGPSSVPAGVVVSDTVPTGTTGSESEPNCAMAAGVFTCTTTAPLASGASVAYQLTLAVPSGYAPATVVNTVSITSSPVADPVAGNNSATDTDNVARSADLSITKSDAPDPVGAGQNITYTLSVTNTGPSDASGVTVADTLPASVVFVSALPSQGSCSQAVGVVTCPLGSLAFGATATISIVVTTTIDGTITNTATVSSGTADPNPANDSDSEDTTVAPASDLQITKNDGVASVTAGTSTTYTITVTNNGPSNVPAGVVVSDTIPANTTGSESEPNCSIAAGVFTCTTTAPLAPLGTASYQLTLAVAANFPGANLSNTASITSSPVTDPTPGNNSDTDTDAVTSSADLQITKTDSVASVTAGTSTTYAITVTNNGPSSVPAGVIVSDTIPAGTTGSESEPNCTIVGIVFSCTTTAPLASGASVVYQLTLAVPSGYVGATVVNTTSITSSPVTDPTPGNDSATDTDTVTSSADLSITKADSADPVDPGISFSYTLTVTNNGPSDATALVASDIVPVGFTIASVTSGLGSCGNIGNLATCTLASLSFGATWTITINVNVDPAAPGGLYTDTATVTSATADPNPANDSDSEGTVVTPAADLQVTKSDGVGAVVAGTSTTYTITLKNNGPSAEPAGVVISDTIPAGTTGSESEANCAIGAGVFTCTTVAPLGPGASVTYQLTLAVDANYPGVALANTAQITGSPLADPDNSNDSATDTDAVTASADLSITKSDAPDPVDAGNDIVYTLTVTNAGPSEATGVVVTDTLPGSVVFVSATPSQGSCAYLAGVVTCPLGVLAVGGSASITITVTTTTDGTVVNTASVTSAATDPAPGDNSATETTTVDPSADLAITKTNGAATFTPGTSATYTITITNNGPSNVPAGVVVADTIPAGTTGSEAEPDCAIAFPVFSCTTSSALVSGASVSYQLTLFIPSSYPSLTLSNSANIVMAPVPDPDASNDSATDVDAFAASADLSIVKTDAPDPVIVGGDVVYTLTVTNNGPSDAIGVVVTDTLPASVTFGSAIPSQGSCSELAGVVTCPLGPVAASGVATITITVTTTAVGSISDTAGVTSATADAVPGNDSDTETTTVVALSADLSVTKTDGVASVVPGASTTYVITIANAGPSTEPVGVVLADPIPAGTIGSESEADCTIVANVFVCATTVALAPGASVSYQLTLSVPANFVPATLSNTAGITSAPLADPDASNDAATDVDAVGASADLAILKTDAPDPVTVGGALTYTLAVSNTGPSDAASVVVTDTLPASVTFGSATPSQGSCSQAAGVITCNLGTIATGGSATVTVGVTPTVAGVITNSAVVSAATTDPVPGNNSASQSTTVGSSADVAITKSDGIMSVTIGASVTYVITLTNNGPSTVPSGITVTDTIPAGTTATESEADCSLTGSVFTCVTSAPLAIGASVSYRLTVSVPAGYVPTMLSNTAAIASSPVPDPNAANDIATDIDAVTTLSADLAIAKTDSADPVDPGQSFSYAIVVTNAGPDTASNVVVIDTVPALFTVTGVSSTQGSCAAAGNSVTCSLPSLAASATWAITIQVTVRAGAAPGAVTNIATVAGVGDTDPANDSASQSTTIGGAPGSSDLAVTKTVSDAAPLEGDTITYDITVTNNGPDDATGVQVTDALPAGVSFVSASASAGSYDDTNGVWDVGPLALGETAELLIQVSVDAGTAGTTITNGAAVSGADQSDPNGGDDADTAPIGVSPAGGGTAFTGFPAGPGPFAWMLVLAAVGLAALGSGRRRSRPRRPGRSHSSGRFLAEPFFFDQG